MRELNTYLTFDGNCREAMTFYHECLGGDLQLMPFGGGMPDVPPGAENRIMHARLAHPQAVLMGSDTMPGMPFQQGNNFSINVNCESLDEIERLYAAFGAGGTPTMALQDTFWGARFGMLRDRFGVQWMFNFEKGTAPTPG